MENLKTYAIVTIAACAITITGVGQATNVLNELPVTYHNNWNDTLSTEQFIQQLSIASAKEINLSKLARKKTKESKVREYAVKVMDASILVYSDLKPFADARNVKLADSSTFVPDQLIAVLTKSADKDFDRQYLSISIEDHNQTIALLEKGTGFGDTTIVAFANKQLSVFRKNLEEAKYLSKNINTSNTIGKMPHLEKMK
jgi:putative membrane protein